MVSKMSNDSYVIPLEIQKELDHYRKSRVPRCSKCKVNFIHTIDSKTKKLSKYLWKPNCDCKGIQDLRLCIG